MLDEKDIQMIAKLMDERLDRKFESFEQRIDGKLETLEQQMNKKLDQQKRELHGEFMTVIESEVTPKLRLLAEGQEAILEKMVPVSRIDALEADVIVLKDAVKYLSEKVQALEKAQ